MPAASGVMCRHCAKKPVRRPRGLCWNCYYAPGVKELYPCASSHHLKREPTQEELDQIVAEQSANLPEWWGEESARLHRGEDV